MAGRLVAQNARFRGIGCLQFFQLIQVLLQPGKTFRVNEASRFMKHSKHIYDNPN